VLLETDAATAGSFSISGGGVRLCLSRRRKGSLGHLVNEYRMLRHQMLAKVRLIRRSKTPC